MNTLRIIGILIIQILVATLLLAILSMLVVIMDDDWGGGGSQRILASAYGIYIQIVLLPFYGITTTIYAIIYKHAPAPLKKLGIFLPVIVFTFIGLPIVFIFFEWLGFVMVASVIGHILSAILLYRLWHRQMDLHQDE